MWGSFSFLFTPSLHDACRPSSESWTGMAIFVNNLGEVLHDMGDLQGAKEYSEPALEILQNRLGKDHPDTKLVRKNLESLRR